MTKRNLVLLGIRGVPAQHGGFETFAEYLCRYLVERGWHIVVYCQEDGGGPVYESEWQRVRRIHIPIKIHGPLGTILFDLKSVVHSLRHNGIFLTLGYNTAIFNVMHRVFRKINVINMDGIEWKRKKWGAIAKAWFWLNERLGCRFGDHLVADHPRIEDHLASRVSRNKITMIPYGGLEVRRADVTHLEAYGLTPQNYAIVIARAEPENSILEIVEGFSCKKRGYRLLVLGNYSEDNAYQRAVLAAASSEVIFPGAIYDVNIVSSLRYYAAFYVHGHQVGGTNPSLVEALGAGNAILAHDNPFNRWVAKKGAIYFSGKGEASAAFAQLYDDQAFLQYLRDYTRKNFHANFRWGDIIASYEKPLIQLYPQSKR